MQSALCLVGIQSSHVRHPHSAVFTVRHSAGRHSDTHPYPDTLDPRHFGLNNRIVSVLKTQAWSLYVDLFITYYNTITNQFWLELLFQCRSEDWSVRSEVFGDRTPWRKNGQFVSWNVQLYNWYSITRLTCRLAVCNEKVKELRRHEHVTVSLQFDYSISFQFPIIHVAIMLTNHK